MRMSPKVRVMVGAITTMIFLGFGLTSLAESQYILGGILVALGCFRGWFLVREISDLRQE